MENTTIKRRRELRAAEKPIIGGLPREPGIVAAFKLSPNLESHLRGLAQVLLVDDFPGSTLTRGERELLAAYVCHENHCFYGLDLHASIAAELLPHEGHPEVHDVVTILESGVARMMFPRLTPLMDIASVVRKSGSLLRKDDVQAAKNEEFTDGDVQLTVLIASAYCMYNRITDGFRSKVAANPRAYRERAVDIAANGYIAGKI